MRALLFWLAALTMLVGCHRGSQEVAPEPEPSKLDVTYMDDRGVTATSFQIGDSIFVSIAGLKPRELYGVALHGPVVGSAALGETASAQGSLTEGQVPTTAGPGEGEAPLALGAENAAAPPSPSIPSSIEEASPSPNTAAPDSHGAGAQPTTTPRSVGESSSLETTSEPSASLEGPPSEAVGALAAQGVLISDHEGRIPATAIARAIGIVTGTGAGRYTLLVTSGGTEVGRSVFEVREGSRPVVHAADATGRPVLRFTRTSESSVWVSARKLAPSIEVPVFVVPDSPKWKNGDSLDPATGRVVEGTTDAGGKLLVEVWPSPDTAGAYDIVLDLDNDGLLSPDDVVTGVWTTGFVVADDPLVRGEVDLVARLVCAEDVYSAGPRARLGSNESLFLFGAPAIGGDLSAVGGLIHIVPHKAVWADGDELVSRGPVSVSPPAVDPASLTRVLAWPQPMLPGQYDVIIDVDRNGRYSKGVDIIDNISAGDAGLVVMDAGNLVTVRGTVVNEDGSPIAGAVVSSAAAAADVTTTAEGAFALPQVLPIPTTVQVIAEGYAPATVPVVPTASEVEVALPPVVLTSAHAAGSPYFPLIDGAEWKYTLQRTITRRVTTGERTEETVVKHSGTLLRGLVASAEGTYVLTETETVFVESADPNEAGETSWTRSIVLEQAPAGLSRVSPDGGLWLPAEVVDGAQYVAGPFDIGQAKVSGRATITTGASVTTESGEHVNCVLVDLTPTSATGFDLGNTTATGSVRLWLAPEVGEVSRQVEVSLDVLDRTPSGDSVTGAVTISESLSLMRADL